MPRQPYNTGRAIVGVDFAEPSRHTAVVGVADDIRTIRSVLSWAHGKTLPVIGLVSTFQFADFLDESRDHL